MAADTSARLPEGSIRPASEPSWSNRVKRVMPPVVRERRAPVRSMGLVRTVVLA
jgi:hypothetical protein